MQFKNRYTQVISALLLSYLLFFLVRVFFYFLYFDYFSELTYYEAFLSFIMGFRVDTAEIFTFTSLIWLALLLPFYFTLNKTYRVTLGALWGIIIASIVFFNIGDSLYFGFVNRHLSDELNLIGSDVAILFHMAMDYYFYQTIVSTFVFFVIIYLFIKLFSAQLEKEIIKQREWVNIFLLIIIAFVGIRGKVTDISFAISDAFAVNKLASGNLALNGFFCYYRSGDRSSVNHEGIEFNQAIKTIKSNLSSQKTLYANEDFPLMRAYSDPVKQNYNVVIVLIESFSAPYLDALSHNNYGVTPTLDKMAKDGLMFTDFYANGQRSSEAVTSIYTGIVQPYGFESLGGGLELYKPSYMGIIAEENGYSTLAMQSGDRGSFRVDKISSLAGFTQYYGAEDYPQTGKEEYEAIEDSWDGDMLRFYSSKLHTMKEPFISFAFTATTHAPYYSPGEKWQKFPHNTNSENGFLNNIYYVDTQIKEFMQRSKKEPWFDRTIFIFTADHTNHAKLSNQKEVANAKSILLPEFHIPLIIYAPKIFEAKVINKVGSQVDILTTIMDYLGWNSNFTSISNSLFDESVQKRVAFVRKGSTIALTDGQSVVNYNFNTFLDGEGNSTKELEKLLLSIDTAQAKLLKTSKWMK